MITLDITKKIKLAIAYAGISEAELARRLGTTPAAFNNRMKRAKFSIEDLEQIAVALDCKFKYSFSFKDIEL